MVEIKKKINIEELITSKVLEALFINYKSYLPNELQNKIYNLVCYPDKVEDKNYNTDISSLIYYENYIYDNKKGM